jgi:hypothetical protein
MGRIFVRKLEDSNLYICSTCSLHLSSDNLVISKSFHGRGGKAYLMDTVINVYTGFTETHLNIFDLSFSSGPQEKRVLMTGLHTVSDIFCTNCHTLLGWKYDEAFEESEKYKINKFILEKTKITKLNW